MACRGKARVGGHTRFGSAVAARWAVTRSLRGLGGTRWFTASRIPSRTAWRVDQFKGPSVRAAARRRAGVALLPISGSWPARKQPPMLDLGPMPKTAAQLRREVAEILADKPVCAGLDAAGITRAPLTEAKRLASAEFERCYLVSVLESAGSVSEAARVSGLDRANFRKLLHRHGIR